MNDKERIDTQRLFFGKRKPLSLKYRLQSLKRLQKTIRQYESDIEKALENDKQAYALFLYSKEFALRKPLKTIYTNLYTKAIRPKSDLF